MSFIELKNIKKRFGEQDSAVYALNGVDLKVEQRESIAIMGTSGSGKSTLLNIIGTLDIPTSGKYYLRGKDIREYNKKEVAQLRNSTFGFVMQDFALIPHYTVAQNIALPLEYTKLSRRDKKEKVQDLLEQMKIAEKETKYSSQLSGGQKQRIAIARALVNDADILLCDEPTGALDSKTTSEIMEILLRLNTGGKTLIIVTHDEKVARYCGRKICIEDGRLL